jgi:hypothetical protein
LIHIDIKKLGKLFDRIGHRITGDRTGQSSLRARGGGLGWEDVNVCIDDASRIAFSRVMKSERQSCAVAPFGVRGAFLWVSIRFSSRNLKPEQPQLTSRLDTPKLQACQQAQSF